MLVLLFVALWFILRGYLFYILPCVIFVFVFFSPFSIVIIDVWEGLRFVIVALPGLFTYFFVTVGRQAGPGVDWWWCFFFFYFFLFFCVCVCGGGGV